MTEREYWLYLAKIKEIDSRRRRMLLETFGNPEEIYRAEVGTLRKVPLLNDSHVEALLRYRKIDLENEMERMIEKGISFVTFSDREFPERLRDIPDPPVILFFKGEFPKNNTPAVAIVGSRNCSMYGKEICSSFSKRLASAGITIVSGMALGLDGHAHRGALEAGGKTVAVLGCGADVCYPPANRDIYEKLGNPGANGEGSGSIISEYYPGETPMPYYFPQRNRIISGLADVLLVIEAREKSGTLITVDHALEQGKEIFAIPGRIGDALSEGCNSLIKNGAHIATEPEDIISELKVHFEILLYEEKGRKKKKLSSLNGEERMIYECLSFDPVQINDISDRTGIPFDRLPVLLIGMEMKDVIEETGKNMYIRKN